MLGGTGGGGVATSPGADNLLTVTVARDEHGYGMKVSGDNPVYVQSVKEHGAAWRAGLRSGDRILRVDSVPVHHHTHQQVVQLIRANPSPVLTVQQNSSRHKTPITAPQPVNPEKQRQLEATKAHTFRMMLEQEQKYIRDLRNELLKVPDVRKQAELAAAEQRCCNLQTRIDSILAAQPEAKPATPKMPRAEKNAQNTSFLSGLPRSLSNLTGQSLRNLRTRKDQPLIRQNSEESKKRHNNTVPMVPTTCLDNTPPPLPPRSERFNSPPLPLKPSTSRVREMRRSSHSLDELEPQPNSIAMQLSYPLVNVPPPPLQTDNRSGLPIMHVRSQSSPEQLDDLTRSVGERPPGTPPPPYPHQPCGDPQRAIISMEEDDSPASDNSTYSGLFSNLRSVRDSRARMAVLINWLLGERRSACAALLLVLTDGYRAAAGVPLITLRRWAYELQSTFLMPAAVLQLNGVDENMANEIDHILVNEHDKEELLRNVFRKARRLAKDELARQLSDFQLKRRAGLGALYGPADDVLKRCALDRQQEQIVVERLMTARLTALAAPPTQPADAHAALLAAVSAAALCLGCRPASVAAAVGGGARATFLQRDKPYKQRVKQLAKQHPQPFIVRGHHLQAQALTAANHCHHCGAVIAGIAPQAFVCTDCNLRVHRACARAVEETCVLEHGDHGNRISRLMERMTPAPHPGLESDKKSRKSSGSAHFLNMERSFRKNEDIWDQPTASPVPERRDESDESLYESADGHSDAISASDDALPRLGKTPTISKESLKLAVTDEEADYPKLKKGHRKTMSLSHPFEIVKSLGDELFEHKNDKKSRESLWSEEDGKTDKKKDDVPKRKTSKGSSVSALNFLRRKKTPTSMKAVEAVVEVVDGLVNTNEILSRTKFFLEEEKRYAEVCLPTPPPVETDSDEELPAPKIEHRRRLSRQTSRSKSKVRGKSQSVRVNTLRKSHSGTLKKGKKKSVKSTGRSRQASFVEPSPTAKKKNPDAAKQNSWLFSNKGEPRREGSHEEPPAAEGEGEPDTKEPDKENEKSWRGATRGVNRAESCRERDAPRRGKHRNASDPNRLTAHPNHDLEPGAATAPSGSSSSSSLSSRSNESNTVPPDQASQSDWSEEEEPLAAQWSDSLPPAVRDALVLSARLRKRQEVIHELIVSEGSHVRWLKVLGVDFLKPLERQPTLLSADELRALFPNLPSVRERHSRLYAELRSARESAPQHVVQIRPIADALLNTLGEAGYAACLSKFCQGQRMALDALRERRRKSKELQQFLAGREQLPRCGRLQLRDLLACVWQRLTKYQLLLEGIIKTVHEGTNNAEGDSDDAPEDAARLKAALAVAKEVLHSVDTAIRTAENEHRLRTIQSKLEIRVGTLERAEADELRRTDLTQCRLRYEGELLLRADTKKTAVLALLLEDRLVLLQREGDKFVLRPVPTAAAGAQLLPVIKWDKVLFRPNAAVRNTFFLMNINGIQMHELSATTAAEYAIWVKHIQESPLARLAEVKSVAPPAPPPPEHHGTNVSRNPSDASEKSTTSTHSCEREGATETEDRRDTEERERQKQDEEENEKGTEKGTSSERDSEEKHTPTVGRISTHLASPATLESCTVTASVCTASRCVTPAERLRRLDAAVTRALRAKAAAAAEMLRVPVDQAEQLAEIAAEDTLRQLEAGGDRGPPDLHQLLLAAQAQANQLTEILNSALSVSEGAVVAARAGRCDRCCRRDARPRHTSETRDVPESDSDETSGRLSGAPDDVADMTETEDAAGNPDPNSDWARSSEEFSGAAGAGAAALAARLAGAAGGLQAVLGALLATLPALEAERTSLRQQLAVARERADRDYHMSETLPRGNMDQSILEQPSHGG